MKELIVHKKLSVISGVVPVSLVDITASFNEATSLNEGKMVLVKFFYWGMRDRGGIYNYNTR
jgi:hypothetical protein